MGILASSLTAAADLVVGIGNQSISEPISVYCLISSAAFAAFKDGTYTKNVSKPKKDIVWTSEISIVVKDGKIVDAILTNKNEYNNTQTLYIHIQIIIITIII